MFCTNCGAILPDNTQQCPNCGKVFTAPAPQAPEQPAAQPVDEMFVSAQAPTPPLTPNETMQMPGFDAAAQPMPQASQPYMPQQPDGAQPYMPQQPVQPQPDFGAPPMGGVQQPGAVPASPYVGAAAPAAAAQKKSNVPKIVGIIAGVVVLVAIIGAIAGGGGSESDSGGATTFSSNGTDTSEGTGDDTSWFDEVDTTTDGTESDPVESDPDADLTPQDEPANGEVLMGGDLETWSTITIKAAEDESCYVKLKDGSDNDVFAFYVRAGQEAEVNVPAGQMYIYFASGETWYGTEDLFGSKTDYSMDPEILDLDSYTYTYTLHAVEGGNFQTEDIDESQF